MNNAYDLNAFLDEVWVILSASQYLQMNLKLPHLSSMEMPRKTYFCISLKQWNNSWNYRLVSNLGKQMAVF